MDARQNKRDVEDELTFFETSARVPVEYTVRRAIDQEKGAKVGRVTFVGS
jgi:hypothetical protein